ncbi:MAG: 6-bladed beta-propeller, partial [Nitrosopumilales archaeon CG15_BIG_FIL_POST_REV_8_21_14_020_37_12]
MVFYIQNYFAVIIIISAVLSVAVFDISYAAVFPVFDFEFGQFGTGNGDFKTPEDVVFYANNIYVADTSNNRIQKFDSAGNYILQFGSRGSNDGQFRSPSGIAIDSSN